MFSVMACEAFAHERYGGLFGGKIHVDFLQGKRQICHQNVTTIFTLKLRVGKELCQLVPTMGAISYKICTHR